MLVYTFRTFPYIAELQELYPNLIIVGPLKQSLEIIKRQTLESSPEVILGIAKASSQSHVETLAINSFGKGKVSRLGKKEYILEAPNFLEDFSSALRPSNTFCNWMMYKIGEFIEQKNLSAKNSFIHITPNDIPQLKIKLPNTSSQLKIS